MINKLVNYLIKYNNISDNKIEEIIPKIKKILLLENYVFSKSADFIFEEHKNTIEKIRQHLYKKIESQTKVENAINMFFSLFLKKQKDLKDITLEKLYEISKIHYYIKYDKIKKNIYWKTNSKYGFLNMTINKIKPEKTTKEIAENLKKDKIKDKDEPQCVICVENIGYTWKNGKDSKENLRVKFLNLNGGKWFFQYSPYAYIDKHFIINSLKHEPMKMDINTIKVQLEFVSQNTDFFLGSNTDIPITGGSLLSHNHFQGGEYILPIFNSSVKSTSNFGSDVLLHNLNWPMTTLLLESNNIQELIEKSKIIINSWKNFPFLNENNNNSITTICRKKNNKFLLYFILRNNSTSKENPFGNFHIKPNKFNIKQENIGLMEAAGLSILPKRLEKEFKTLIEYHNSGLKQKIPSDELTKKHLQMYKENLEHQKNINMKKVLKIAGNIFILCLEDCNVFHNNNNKYMKKFMDVIKNAN